MTTNRKVYTFKATTNGMYKKITDFCDIEFTNDNSYSVQIIGNAKLTYSNTLPTDDEGYAIGFSQPLTYDKKPNEDLYFKTGTNEVIVTIAVLPGISCGGGTNSGGGGTVVIEALVINPSTSEQLIPIRSGIDGYGPVTVNPVTSSIDENISSGNIKAGVTILDVTGNVIELEGETRTEELDNVIGNTYTPSSNKNAITSITVTPKNEDLTITPTTSSQTHNVPSGKSGYGTITVNPIHDNYLLPANIKKDVTILGVTGSYEGTPVPETRLGVGINNIIGSVVNGSLGTPDTVNGVNFTGVTTILQNACKDMFINKPIQGSVMASDLVTVNEYGLNNAFRGTSVTSVSMPNLTTIEDYGMQNCFNGNNSITSLNLSSLYEVGTGGLDNCFNWCTSLQGAISLNNLTTIEDYGMNQCFQTCGNITSFTANNLTTIEDYGMQNCLNSCTSLVLFALPAVTTLNSHALDWCCWGCWALTTIDLSSVTYIGDGALTSCFYNCYSLTGTIDLSSVTYIGDMGLTAAFTGTKITGINLDGLEEVAQHAFWGPFHGCPITTFSFPSLVTIAPAGLEEAFHGIQNPDTNQSTLTSVSFPALTANSFESGDTTAFYDMFNSAVDGCTVHFPAALQSVIGSWSDVQAGFGGTNITVLFDL